MRRRQRDLRALMSTAGLGSRLAMCSRELSLQRVRQRTRIIARAFALSKLRAVARCIFALVIFVEFVLDNERH